MKTFRTTLADAHEEINALRAQLAAVTAELAAIKALTPDSPFSGGVTVQQLWAGFRGADGALADAGTVATPTTPLDVETGIRALTAERDAARAECERLRKLFDDAGAGEHNVLALIDHYQDEALKATSELVQARQLVALLEDRISDVEDRDDARTVCEWAATVALKSTDVHNAATRYLTGVQSPLRTRLAEVERERDADMRNVERALALADRLRSERDALAAEKALLTRRLKSIPRVVRPSRLPVPPRLEFRRESDGELVSDECECECGHSRHRHTRYERRCQVDKCDCDAFRGSANEET